MKHLFAIILAFLVLSAIAQPQGGSRDRNNARVMEIVSESVGLSQAEIRKKLDTFLATLPSAEAFDAEVDLVEVAQRQGLLSESSYARERLALIRKYVPDSDANADLVREYWGYRLVVASKLDRKEIPSEEFDYLVEKKRAEILRESAKRDAEASQRQDAINRQAEQARRAQLAEIERQQADQRQLELERDTIMINSFRRSLEPLTRPTTRCTTTRVFGQLQTVCN
jgi:hypothetical protein